MTVLAIVFALAAAMVFGVAAVNQHGAVREMVSTQQRRLRLGQLENLISNPGWRRGFTLMGLGTGLHIAALSLAPISLTQPINVLAVPTTIIAAAVASRHRPRPQVLLAAAAVVLGVAGFVTALSDATPGQVPSGSLLAVAAVLLVAGTVVLHAAARLLTRIETAPRWLAPVLLGAAGALSFGTASSIFRLLAEGLGGSTALMLPTACALAVAVPVALAIGAWSIHQAYAAGAASSVTAASALADPVVAITLGMALLGETHQLTTGRILIMTVAAGIAATGVVHLARRGDDVPGRPGDTQLGSAPPQRLSLTTTRNPYAHLARR